MDFGKLRHLCEETTAKSSMKASKLQHRVTRTRVRVASCWNLGAYSGPSGSGESQLRPISVPARGTKEFGQLDSDRVSLSPESGLGVVPKREVVAIGPDRARRVTQ
jgi:hypothetical protein